LSAIYRNSKLNFKNETEASYMFWLMKVPAISSCVGVVVEEYFFTRYLINILMGNIDSKFQNVSFPLVY